MTLPAYSITVTDLAGSPHTIADHVRELKVTTELTDATDAFEFEILNESDTYSYIEKGCAIEISTGMGSTTKKLDGYITDVIKTLDDGQTKPIMSVAGEDGGIRLNHIFFSGRFHNLEISALLIAILDMVDYTTGNTYRVLADLDASNAEIDSTIYTLDEATYVWKSIGAAIKTLADAVGFAWYRDVDKKLHFYDPGTAATAATITDADLDGEPEIADDGEIVNRAIVVGGFQQNTDRSGNTKTTTTTVTDSVAKNQSFMPAKVYLSSLLVYTEVVTDSASLLTVSIQKDSAGAPDGKNLSNSVATVKFDSIADGGYSEFRFLRDVTLTVGDTYWIVLKGTSSDGVDVGVDGSATPVLDFHTKTPVQVAIMANDLASQDLYGMYTAVYRDTKIETSQYAEIMANSLLRPEPKKVAAITIHGDAITAGDIVRLTLSTAGITINKDMKVKVSTQTLGEIFIYNELELEEI